MAKCLCELRSSTHASRWEWTPRKTLVKPIEYLPSASPMQSANIGSEAAGDLGSETCGVRQKH